MVAKPYSVDVRISVAEISLKMLHTTHFSFMKIGSVFN